MSEDKNDKEAATDFSRIARGCGIAIGVAALAFFLVVGACFIALSGW